MFLSGGACCKPVWRAAPCQMHMKQWPNGHCSMCRTSDTCLCLHVSTSARPNHPQPTPKGSCSVLLMLKAASGCYAGCCAASRWCRLNFLLQSAHGMLCRCIQQQAHAVVWGQPRCGPCRRGGHCSGQPDSYFSYHPHSLAHSAQAQAEGPVSAGQAASPCVSLR